MKRTIEFYEGEESNRIYKQVAVRERHGKYYLDIRNKNYSRANGGTPPNGDVKNPGYTRWDAVRILQGPNSALIDITDFTFAESKGQSNFEFSHISRLRLRYN